MSRNTNDVVKFGDSSYIPVGTYPLISMDTEAHEEGLFWCQFRYTNGNSYYAVYNLPDGRCEIIDTPIEPEPTPEPEPEPEPTPEPKPEISREEFDKAVNRIDDLEKIVSNLAKVVETFGSQLDNLSLEIQNLPDYKDDITTLNNRVDHVYEWVRSFGE